MSLTFRNSTPYSPFSKRSTPYRGLGPSVRQGSIVYDEVASTSDLPIGWTDEQDGGTYRLKRREDDALFGFVVGPHSCQFFQVPVTRLWQANRENGIIQIQQEEDRPQRIASIGVRSCDLHAVAIQDLAFLGGPASMPRMRNDGTVPSSLRSSHDRPHEAGYGRLRSRSACARNSPWHQGRLHGRVFREGSTGGRRATAKDVRSVRSV